ncbi:MAG: anaerobic sulfatase maturase [Candidatus Lokiarchaeota archaeon]|nr:anaerobic sulfatase maturase [Candidatus Lokiarchaeota archaeon]
MEPFQLLIKPISSKCNAACTYCFYRDIHKIFPEKPLKSMPIEILKTMTKKYLKLGFKENLFFWQGGEPLLTGLDFFKKAIEFQIKYAKNQVIGNAVQTNGLLINEKWVDLFKKYSFLIGISLDGPKEIHDPARGKGTHDKVVKVIELMAKNNIEFNILTVLHSGNWDKIEEIYSYLKTIPCNFFQFIPAVDNDIVTGESTDYSITAKQYGDALCKLYDLWYPEDTNKISIRTFDAVINKFFGLPSGLCTFEEKCPNYIVIENQGDVYPCDFFVRPNEKLGKITKDSFEILVKRRNNKFRKRKTNISKACKDCRWLELCYGGCVKDRIFNNNKDKNRTYFCPAYQKFFKYSFHGVIKKVIEVANERHYRPVLLEKFDPNDKCPCGSGKRFRDCLKKS